MSRILIALFALSLAGSAAAAQEKVYRIGIVNFAGEATAPGRVVSGGPMPIKEILGQRGYREGVNVQYDYRAGGRDAALTEKLARELVANRPDLIIVQTTDSAEAVKKAVAGTDVPVVAWATDMVQAGFVNSFRKPGTNFTGFSLVPEHHLSILRIIKLVQPKARKVAHLYNPGFGPAPSTLREFQSAAALFDMQLVVYEAENPAAIDAAFAKMRQDRVDAVTTGPHPLFNREGPRIGELAIKHKLPMVSWEPSALRTVGAIASFTQPPDGGWTLMADRIDAILQGKARAPDLPVLRVVRGALTINLRSAQALGLTVPPSLIDEATTVIE